jgi:hypothetical protein
MINSKSDADYEDRERKGRDRSLSKRLITLHCLHVLCINLLLFQRHPPL